MGGSGGCMERRKEGGEGSGVKALAIFVWGKVEGNRGRGEGGRWVSKEGGESGVCPSLQRKGLGWEGERREGGR